MPRYVEALIHGVWVPARFVEADYVPSDDGDELWWMDYLLLEDGTTIPDDIHSGDKLPPIREVAT